MFSIEGNIDIDIAITRYISMGEMQSIEMAALILSWFQPA